MTEPRDAHRQVGFPLRLEWGLTGATAIGAGCDIAVVVDVLSFTTALSVAADRGITVFPYAWGGGQAARFAADREASVAVGRSVAKPSQVSLSPASIRAAPDPLTRLVLPSPNGSTICVRLAGTVPEVIGASLRNRRAVADWLLSRRREHPDLVVAVVAAGERWPDGTLRPAVEDLWGAGALVQSLRAGGWAHLSPEAQAAAAAFAAVADDIATALSTCASGRELLEIGYQDDVLTAGELDQGRCVPSLHGEAFHPLIPPGR